MQDKATAPVPAEFSYNPRPAKAKVAELVDALDLGSSAARCKSSSLFFRTRYKSS